MKNIGKYVQNLYFLFKITNFEVELNCTRESSVGIVELRVSVF